VKIAVFGHSAPFGLFQRAFCPPDDPFKIDTNKYTNRDSLENRFISVVPHGHFRAFCPPDDPFKIGTHMNRDSAARWRAAAAAAAAALISVCCHGPAQLLPSSTAPLLSELSELSERPSKVKATSCSGRSTATSSVSRGLASTPWAQFQRRRYQNGIVQVAINGGC
jgi:hypothetical protein